nr:hypothetical protein CFP56_64497 [Quercus suber]
MDIGTPSYSALLVMDPGSDTTWIQGDGCSECAALTFLVQNAYNIIRIEIVQYLQAYDWEPIRPRDLPYELCYDVQQAETQSLPSLTIHFLGADLKLPSH